MNVLSIISWVKFTKASEQRLAIDKFKDILKRSYNQFLNETMNDRIKAAISQAEKTTTEVAVFK